jgi:hypothetical protein
MSALVTLLAVLAALLAPATNVAPAQSIKNHIDPDCGIVLRHHGAAWVEIHDADGWTTFDAVRGRVELTLDGNTRTELAPGHYRAIWQPDGATETFDLDCPLTLPPTDTAS